ncbi:MAG: sulfate adenylyltransferase [Candidatus Doudnabacteria bacterium RIFCSPHIGHO2_01_FULL_43_23]|uniref:Sulfate adenylyltransferase n=1 Tax=Candidatus Doudnabacteria bacterium RIFCSPHIGHO2_01_FULL_43_23 TaxID=1817822 RepID=A0A1F5NTF8_9BACT|nr:MAG: sulfate adenylyltransferase [Candidatus Doudnabacteria bacterium RIFCSPHIGHO2_01_FULL_43_23]
MIAPHGGKLINRVASLLDRKKLLGEAKTMPRLVLDNEILKDFHNLAYGTYSPLTGFVTQKDFESVVRETKLASGLAWSIPITLDVTAKQAKGLKIGKKIALTDEKDTVQGILNLEEKYSFSKEEYMDKVFTVRNLDHPGVQMVHKMKPVLLGGPITLLYDDKPWFADYYMTPQETRERFQALKLSTVAGFQTRNAPHRGHEHIQKAALSEVDGVFIHPVIGEKKPGDFKDEVIIAAYQALIKNYYPKTRTVFSVWPVKMKYAGPREAVMHAIVRKNHGCTHHIVGRDHAGIGGYYGLYASQEIFDEVEDTGVHILRYNEVAYCYACEKTVFQKDCPHGQDKHYKISGTKLREFISLKKMPPQELCRPEVAEVLLSYDQPFV